jgi:hypothetical protein
MCAQYGPGLLTAVPKLWQCMNGGLKAPTPLSDPAAALAATKAMVDSLQASEESRRSRATFLRQLFAKQTRRNAVRLVGRIATERNMRLRNVCPRRGIGCRWYARWEGW